MSGIELVLAACWGTTCVAWGCRRCCASGNAVSTTDEWRPATKDEFQDVPRVCRVVLGAYEKDITTPEYADRLNPEQVVKKTEYKDNDGKVPPYIIYIDHDAKDICVGIRGLNMANLADYEILMDHYQGFECRKFDGGYVHNGLLLSAQYFLEKEFDLLNELAKDHPGYTVTFAGHSLGSGVVAMMAVLVSKDKEDSAITRDRLRCYAIAPARSTSLNLAIRYSDIINAIILQDDFLPRTVAPIEEILAASFCLPFLLCAKCTRDLCTSEEAKLKDETRLYVPGRLFHIVYLQDFSCQTNEPVVKTAVEVKQRFEHIVFSRTTVDDHSIMVIEAKATAAIDEMERGAETEAPASQSMDRRRKEEVVAALRKCHSLGIPNAKDPAEAEGELAALEAVAKENQQQQQQPTAGAPQQSDEAQPLGGEEQNKGEPKVPESVSAAGQKWRETLKRLEDAPKRPEGAQSRWGAILSNLTEEGKEVKQPPKERLLRLPSLAITGAP